MNVVVITLVVFTTISVTVYCACFLPKHFKALSKGFAPRAEKEIFDAFISFEKREIEEMEKDYTRHRISIRQKFISKLQQEIEEMEAKLKS